MLKLRDFSCRECGLHWEALSQETTGVKCPRCGGIDTRFAFSPQAIKVNGQGAYTNKMKVT